MNHDNCRSQHTNNSRYLRAFWYVTNTNYDIYNMENVKENMQNYIYTFGSKETHSHCESWRWRRACQNVSEAVPLNTTIAWHIGVQLYVLVLHPSVNTWPAGYFLLMISWVRTSETDQSVCPGAYRGTKLRCLKVMQLVKSDGKPQPKVARV